MTVLDSASLHKFLLHFTGTLTPELAEHFVKLPPDPDFQQRLDELGGLANEGALSEEERREYEVLVRLFNPRIISLKKTTLTQPTSIVPSAKLTIPPFVLRYLAATCFQSRSH